MILEGTIRSVEGHIVRVEGINPVRCGSPSGCGGGTSCCSQATVVFRALRPEHLDVKQGDYVRLSPPRGNAPLAFALFFGVPVTSGVLTLWLTSGLFGDRAALFAIGAGLLSLALLAMIRDNRGSLPKIIQVIPRFDLKKTPDVAVGGDA